MAILVLLCSMIPELINQRGFWTRQCSILRLRWLRWQSSHKKFHKLKVFTKHKRLNKKGSAKNVTKIPKKKHSHASITSTFAQFKLLTPIKHVSISRYQLFIKSTKFHQLSNEIILLLSHKILKYWLVDTPKKYENNPSTFKTLCHSVGFSNGKTDSGSIHNPQSQ